MTMQFRLKGRATIFNQAARYTSGTGPGAIACVHGVTLDGKHETRARLADVEFLDAVDQAAELAKQDQLTAMTTAQDPFEAYWAGSASASVAAHYRRGAVRTIHTGARR